jgi:esterase/lipase superfamily enzyme
MLYERRAMTHAKQVFSMKKGPFSQQEKVSLSERRPDIMKRGQVLVRKGLQLNKLTSFFLPSKIFLVQDSPVF